VLLKQIKEIFHKELDQEYGREEVAHFFYHFIEEFLGEPRFLLVLHPERIIDKEEEGQFFKGLAELKSGRPLQYILGGKAFMDLSFKVNENVLIPRPETEELVRLILKDYQDSDQSLNILDLGTGSGCIAVSLAKYLPGAAVDALDVSAEALELAGENAENNEVNVSFRQADLRHMEIEKDKYHIIVSNPPYVLEGEKESMESNVKDAEPSLALFVPDNRPLLYYEYIVRLAAEGLVEGGCLYLEINHRFGREMSRLLSDGGFGQIELIRDMHGKDRFLKARNYKNKS
jgi:release factor glutamine methyltransferase